MCLVPEVTSALKREQLKDPGSRLASPYMELCMYSIQQRNSCSGESWLLVVGVFQRDQNSFNLEAFLFISFSIVP